jgi:uncharacterized protein YerC
MDAFVRIDDHLTIEQVMERMQMIADSLQLKKWLVIYNAIVDPRPLSEIAMHTGLTEATVSRIIDEYNLLGPQALERLSMSAIEKASGKRSKYGLI